MVSEFFLFIIHKKRKKTRKKCAKNLYYHAIRGILNKKRVGFIADSGKQENAE